MYDISLRKEGDTKSPVIISQDSRPSALLD